MVERVYNSKLLLFGEYSVLNHSSSLAIPYEAFFLQRQFQSRNKADSRLLPFIDYLRALDLSHVSCFFDDKLFSDDVEKGVEFVSNIPVGYGLGSSGAITAAVFDLYFEKPIPEMPLSELKMALSAIEGFFHGKSSGMDPLVSYLNRGVFSSGPDRLETVTLHPQRFHPYSLYLLDSGISRSTQKYVEQFKEKSKTEAFSLRLKNELIPLVNTVNASLAGRAPQVDIFEVFSAISQIQFDLFPEMMVPEIKAIWRRSLSDPDHTLKLCGAGGGGFYFLLSRNPAGVASFCPGLKTFRVFGE